MKGSRMEDQLPDVEVTATILGRLRNGDVFSRTLTHHQFVACVIRGLGIPSEDAVIADTKLMITWKEEVHD